MSNYESTVRELQTLLETENARLISGDFTDMQEIIDAKMGALRELQGWMKQGFLPGSNDPSLNILQTLGERNGILLKAIINGVKYALVRIEKLQMAESSLGAYDRMGRGMRIDAALIKNTIIM